MENQYAKIETEISDECEKVVSLYFKEFLNKFENFSNGMRIVEVLLKVYQLRYDKFKEKFSNVNEIISSNYEGKKEFIKRADKLDFIEGKLTIVEAKLLSILTRLDNMQKVESKENN